MDNSFDENQPIDINSVIAEFSNGDDQLGKNGLVKKLSEAFDGCIKTGNDEYMKVFLRVRPISKGESTIVVDSDFSILTNAPETSRRALYTKTEARNYVIFEN